MPKEYIDRDAAREYVYRYLKEQTVSKYLTSELCMEARRGISGTLEVLDDVPAADVVPVVHGEWIHHYYDSGKPIDDKWYCSECQMCNDHKRALYCPNCGAKMY